MKNYTVDRTRWAKMNIFEQMGNIYSEVGRTTSAKRRGDTEGCLQGTARALDLFDATVEVLVSQKSPRTKEVLRAKDQFLHTIFDQETTPESFASLDKYFLQFAIAARLHR